MSDPADRPAADGTARSDDDAWASACAEDLAAERTRRREQYGSPTGSFAQELGRFAEAVSGKLSELGKPLVGSAGSAAVQGAAEQLFAQARSAVEPVIERNPEVFEHLSAAGGELLEAYRSAVRGAEGRWTSGTRPHGTGGDTTEPGDTEGADRGPAAGRSGVERIDLDTEAPGDTDGTEGGNQDRQDRNEGGDETGGTPGRG